MDDVDEGLTQRDLAQRTIELPLELDAALRGDKAARARFDALPPSHRREYADWVAGAKKAETRIVRATKSLAMIHAGRPAR